MYSCTLFNLLRVVDPQIDVVFPQNPLTCSGSICLQNSLTQEQQRESRSDRVQEGTEEEEDSKRMRRNLACRTFIFSRAACHMLFYRVNFVSGGTNTTSPPPLSVSVCTVQRGQRGRQPVTNRAPVLTQRCQGPAGCISSARANVLSQRMNDAGSWLIPFRGPGATVGSEPQITYQLCVCFVSWEQNVFLWCVTSAGLRTSDLVLDVIVAVKCPGQRSG